MNPRDPLLGQQTLGGVFLHEVESKAEPLIHVTRTRRPEIVVFGQAQPLQTPMMVMVDKTLLVKSEGKDRMAGNTLQGGKR